VTYIRPVPVGEIVLVESSVVHAGRRLCTITGVMKRESTGEVSPLSSIVNASGTKMGVMEGFWLTRCRFLRSANMVRLALTRYYPRYDCVKADVYTS
jgi:hypothetical protein